MSVASPPVPELLHRLLRVVYPAAGQRLVLRTEADWTRDVEPSRVVDGQRFEFEISHQRPYLHFKPCLRSGEELIWAEGANKLLLLGPARPHAIFPHFHSGQRGHLTDLMEIFSETLGRRHRLRVYLPAGYEENHLKHYPVLYMQDGANAFFPEDAFQGRDWAVDHTLDLLDRMSLIDKTLVVGVYADDREQDYTEPGWDAYGRSLVTEIKPFVDDRFRTLPGRSSTSLMGSSLGGVVSFYLGWQWPQVFGQVACLSSTFGYRDDLVSRVRRDDVGTRTALRVYLDSGWPHDNYEATLGLAVALVERGFVLGSNLHHFAFPLASHDEGAWGARCHLPLQLFSGRLRRVAGERRRVVGTPRSKRRPDPPEG